MANINLYQTDQLDAQNKQPGILAGGMVVAFIFFFVVLIAYGGVEFYFRSLEQKTVDLQAEEAAGRQAINEKDVNLAASFQQRLGIVNVGAESFTREIPNKVFEEIQKSVIKGVVALKISFKDKNASLSLEAENFEVLSRQILSFKESDFFNRVDVVSSSRNEEGKVEAVLSLGVSN